MKSLNKLETSLRWRSSFAFYKLARLWKSRKNPPISWKPPRPEVPRLVSCVYEADVPLLRQCIRTLYEQNSRPPAVLLVGDSQEAMRALQTSFADGGEAVEIAFWQDLWEDLPPKSKQFVQAWLGGGPFGGYAKKFAVTLAINQREAMVMCDADVLFGGDFFEKLEEIKARGEKILSGEDYRASYDKKAVELLEEPRILKERPLNCGMVYYPKGILPSILDEDLLERALPLTKAADNHLEQTLIAYAFWKSEGDFFPRDMLATTLEDNLRWGKGLNSMARHYAGGKHLFWRDV